MPEESAKEEENLRPDLSEQEAGPQQQACLGGCRIWDPGPPKCAKGRRQ
jgi:hypothetical protein